MTMNLNVCGGAGLPAYARAPARELGQGGPRPTSDNNGKGRAAASTPRRPNLNCVLIIFCFLVLLCFSTMAPGATNEVVNVLSPAAVDEKTFDASALLRDPFWPIGYVPPSKPGVVLESAKSVDPARDKKTAFQAAGLSGMLKIGGVIRSGGRFYATINGFTVQAGEVITVVVDGEVYKFIVEKIDFKKVQFKPIGR